MLIPPIYLLHFQWRIFFDGRFINPLTHALGHVNANIVRDIGWHARSICGPKGLTLA